MKKILLLAFTAVSFTGCFLDSSNVTKESNKELSTLFNNYYEERMKLFPLEATANGDNRYNDLLPIDFTNSYRDSLKAFYNNYLTYVSKYDR